MGNSQRKQATTQQKDQVQDATFSSVVSDQVCAFIVNPFPNLAGLEGKKFTFGTDEYAEYVQKCVQSCKSNVGGNYSLCSQEPTYKNAADPLDSITFQLLVPNSKTNFDRQNLLDGDLEDKRRIYALYLKTTKEFKEKLDDPKSCADFMALVARYYMIARSNMFYGKALVLSSLSPSEVQDQNLLSNRINSELKDFQVLAEKTDSDVREFKALQEAVRTKQWRGKFGESSLAQIADPSNAVKQTRPGNDKVYSLNGTQLSLLRVRKFQLIEKYKKMFASEQDTFDKFEMWRKGFGSLSNPKLSSPLFVALQQEVMNKIDSTVPTFATDSEQRESPSTLESIQEDSVSNSGGLNSTDIF